MVVHLQPDDAEALGLLALLLHNQARQGARFDSHGAFVPLMRQDTALWRRDLIDDAESARAELRFIHLSRHLSTPPLLTEDQIARYNTLRGYGSDPCAKVSEGHNSEMWRRHNNCS